MNGVRLTCAFARILALVAAVGAAAPSSARNLVVIVMDDLGVDQLGSYGEVKAGMGAPPEHFVTPRIQALADQGLLFRNVWSSPLCSATRATLITGRYGFATGVGGPVPILGVPGDPPSYQPLAQALAATHPVRTAIGKWHLTWYDPTASSPGYAPVGVPPEGAGFTEYYGTWNNLDASNGSSQHYFDWSTAVHVPPAAPSVSSVTEVYATSYEVDQAIDFVDRQAEGPEAPDWFLWVGLHSIHTPTQVPPDALHTQQDVKDDFEPSDLEPLGTGDGPRIRLAMLQAMDTEVGRLLDALDLSDTTVVLLGDNGSGYALPTSVNSEAKGSIYEGGINVPLIVAGDAVPAPSRGTETAALVHTTDVYATLLELAGASAPPGITLHGVSFAPVLSDPSLSPHSLIYADGVFNQSAKPGAKEPHMHDVALRDARYKLIRFGCEIPDEGNPNRRAFYDLDADPGETDDLLDPPGGLGAGEEAAYAASSAALDSIAGLPPAGGCPHIDPPPPPPPHCGLGFELVLPLAVIALRRRRVARTRPRAPRP